MSPLPPHITLDQARAMMSTLIKGDPAEAGLIKGAAKQVMARVFGDAD